MAPASASAAAYKLTGDDLLMAQWARVNGDYDMMYGSLGYNTDAKVPSASTRTTV
ncbi:MAG: hypothetical protein IPP44_07685 [Ideonella sp.]|nr:hypothetical protein [Ideonella sp.]